VKKSSLSQFKIKKDLKEFQIFLSASIPSADRNESYYIDTNPLDITDAIVTIARSIIVRKGKIIFGGHPTISPLILSVAKNFIPYFEKGDFPFIYIYQSKFFERKISRFTEELLDTGIGQIIWTDAKDDPEESLSFMRMCMIKEKRLNAAIFIGGMEGIEKEYLLFNEYYSNIPFYLLGSTGGATRLIFIRDILNQEKWNFKWDYNNKSIIKKLYNSKQYNYLAKIIIEDIVSR